MRRRVESCARVPSGIAVLLLFTTVASAPAVAPPDRAAALDEEAAGRPGHDARFSRLDAWRKRKETDR